MGRINELSACCWLQDVTDSQDSRTGTILELVMEEEEEEDEQDEEEEGVTAFLSYNGT